MVNAERGSGELGVPPWWKDRERSDRQKPKVSGERAERATFSMEFDHYEKVPENIAQEIIEGKR